MHDLRAGGEVRGCRPAVRDRTRTAATGGIAGSGGRVTTGRLRYRNVSSFLRLRESSASTNLFSFFSSARESDPRRPLQRPCRRLAPRSLWSKFFVRIKPLADAECRRPWLTFLTDCRPTVFTTFSDPRRTCFGSNLSTLRLPHSSWKPPGFADRPENSTPCFPRAWPARFWLRQLCAQLLDPAAGLSGSSPFFEGFSSLRYLTSPICDSSMRFLRPLRRLSVARHRLRSRSLLAWPFSQAAWHSPRSFRSWPFRLVVGWLLALIALICSPIFLSASSTESAETETEEPSVVTTTYPLWSGLYVAPPCVIDESDTVTRCPGRPWGMVSYTNCCSFSFGRSWATRWRPLRHGRAGPATLSCRRRF